MRRLTLREAKVSLSAVVRAAASGEPSVITRRGEPRAVVIGFEEWRRLSDAPSFARLLTSAPLDPEDRDLLERDRTPVRDPDL